LEISTLAFLAARKQNTNKTKQKKARKRAFGTQFNAVSQKVECCVGGALVPWCLGGREK
jgi:CRISPR/Cas system CMR-associated protein Cmr5 small subunit